ncbi:DUF1641 domain-containing protein [Geomicrobium sp. JSM 1781026]|uniref:DUF1641 domain-containing protein n=1 Tax=Geomicrobium sp. JSM 1781026 TaxID=3344580 RepID=UPI0035C23EA2
MAKATKVIHKLEIDPAVQRENDRREVEDLLINNKEVLRDALEVLDRLKEHEVFEMMNAGLGQSDKLLHRIVTAVDDHNTTRSIKNALLLFELLGTLNMNEIEPLVLKVNKGISKVADYEHANQRGGYTALIGALKDPEVIEGMNVLVALVKGMGVEQDSKELIEPQLERMKHPEKEMKTRSSVQKNKQTPPQWVGFAFGAACFLLPFLLRKIK